MKNIKIKGLIVFLITIFLLWFILKDNFINSLNLLFSANYLWVFISAVVYIIYFILESNVYKILINQYDKKYSLKKAINLVLKTRFFNGITPFASGGQPLQVYELKKQGIRITDGTIIQIEQFIIFQLSIFVVFVTSIILNSFYGFVHGGTLLNTLVIIGLIINILILLLIFLITLNKYISDHLFHPIIHFLAKIKIIKNKDRALIKWNQACIDYYQGYQSLKKEKKKVIYLITTEVLALIIWFTSPLFIFFSLGIPVNIDLVTCIVLSTYIFVIGTCIPIPGGSGGIEYAFYHYFSYYVAQIYLSPALVLWRLINYYIPMIIGAIAFNFIKKRL